MGPVYSEAYVKGLLREIEALRIIRDAYTHLMERYGHLMKNGDQNKPYFAKYLPVEGEIKEGGLFYDVELQEVLRLSKEATVSKLPQMRRHPDLYKPVKLFLCSRDIKVGDKCWDDKDKFLFELNNSDALRLYKERGRDYWFKVIGEISREATWVKEEDEFDESEVHRCFIHEDISNLSDPMVRQVQLKGPCGHFH